MSRPGALSRCARRHVDMYIDTYIEIEIEGYPEIDR